jgi:hypothetical protein
MIKRGAVILVRQNPPFDIVALPIFPEHELEPRIAQILALHEAYTYYGSTTSALGDAGEEMVRKAFQASPNFKIISPKWGNVVEYDGKRLQYDADGLVLAAIPLMGRSSADAVCVVEIKNRREWIYPEDFRLWKLILNAYFLDVVGIFFARRIKGTTFGYTLKKVGALGVETFAQFAPPVSEPDLAPVKEKKGLGYHDLYFSENVPPHLQRRVDSLGGSILRARDRMNAVREIVQPHLEALSDEKVIGRHRSAQFAELSSKLRAYDYPPSDDDEHEGEEEETEDALDY